MLPASVTDCAAQLQMNVSPAVSRTDLEFSPPPTEQARSYEFMYSNICKKVSVREFHSSIRSQCTKNMTECYMCDHVINTGLKNNSSFIKRSHNHHRFLRQLKGCLSHVSNVEF